MNLKLPEIKEILKKILSIEATFTGDFIHPILGKTATQSIEKWRNNYIKELKQNNRLNKIEKFNVFITSILLRSSSGEIGGKLYNGEKNKQGVKKYEGFKQKIINYGDINERNLKNILVNAGYRFPNQGLKTILDFKNKIFNNDDNFWNNYLSKAKNDFKNNFKEDEALKIKGIGFKVRDLALSCFLKEYSANDFHVADVIIRTGLIIYGYGDIDFGTNLNKKQNYLFLRDLIIKLAYESGYSPGELDRIFWHFGRTICKPNPLCLECPIKEDCVTYKNSNNKNI